MDVFLFFVLIAGACVWAFWGFFSGFLGGLLSPENHETVGSETGAGWGDPLHWAAFGAFGSDTDDSWEADDDDAADDFDSYDVAYDSYDAADYGGGYEDGGADYSGDY